MSLIDRMQELLEAERAGVKCLDMMADHASDMGRKELFTLFRNDEGKFCAGLFGFLQARGAAPTANVPPGKKAPKGKLAKGETIGENHILGEILAAYPDTEKVFRKYYGDGCFSCPGQATESVKQSAMMHNVSEKQLLTELNRAAGF